MNKTPRLSKSGIEYLDYMWGIFSGCHNHLLGICGGGGIENGKGFNCWAKGIALHFPKLYPNGFEPHYYPEAINSPMHLKKPSRIGVGWVGDVIGYGLEYKEEIFDIIYNCPQHTFLFLTKQPKNLPKWSPFPDNCWVGVSATDTTMFYNACYELKDIKAKVKFISLEPLLDFEKPFAVLDMKHWIRNWLWHGIGWVIIGSQTKPTVYPQLAWVEEIVSACDKAGIPVFLKQNLMPLIIDQPRIPEWSSTKTGLRQEFPMARPKKQKYKVSNA